MIKSTINEKILFSIAAMAGFYSFIVVPIAFYIIIALAVGEGPIYRDMATPGRYNNARPIPQKFDPVLEQVARIGRAVRHIERNETEKAVQILRQASRPGPDRLFLARLLASLGRYEEAVPVYKSLTEKMPYDPDLGKESEIVIQKARHQKL